MKKAATTICLAIYSLGSIAQQSSLQIKNLLPHLSYIPSKSFTSLAYTGSDSVSFYTPRTASAHGFYISRFEVTNKEYREFVLYVRDSMAHILLKHFKKESKLIDWNRKINWDDPLLESMMLSPDERIFGKNEINTNKIMYELDFPGQKEIISIYPDTLVWIRDFAYSYNEPLVKKYFSDKLYDNYPVVGINNKQTMAFCHWKTRQLNKFLKKAGNEYSVTLRLPTNTEWESAAIGSKKENEMFSPGSKYRSNFGTITDKNSFVVKNYHDDGYYYTGPVSSYTAGAYGLYNMKGNVSEWTSDAASTIMNDQNNIGDGDLEMKQSFIVKGGGWKSNPFYLQTGACQFFPATAANSFIGFRYVVYIIKK